MAVGRGERGTFDGCEEARRIEGQRQVQALLPALATIAPGEDADVISRNRTPRNRDSMALIRTCRLTAEIHRGQVILG